MKDVLYDLNMTNVSSAANMSLEVNVKFVIYPI